MTMLTLLESDPELTFWLTGLIATLIALAILTIKSNQSSATYVDDMDAWSRNYEKIQRHH